MAKYPLDYSEETANGMYKKPLKTEDLTKAKKLVLLDRQQGGLKL